MAYKKEAVLPPKVLGKLAAINQVTSSILTDPLSPKKTVMYRGQTVTPDPALRGGDFHPHFERNPELNKASGRFWSQSRHSAAAHAKVVKRRAGGKSPVAVFKAETNKVDVLKGQKDLLAHNKASKIFTGDVIRRDVFSQAKEDIRKGTLYQTLMDPPNKRLSLSNTVKVNPTFKGVRKEALKAAAQVGSRVAARLAGPYAVVDMILNPTPAYNPNDGYQGEADPRRRRKATIQGIR